MKILPIIMRLKQHLDMLIGEQQDSSRSKKRLMSNEKRKEKRKYQKDIRQWIKY